MGSTRDVSPAIRVLEEAKGSAFIVRLPEHSGVLPEGSITIKAASPRAIARTRIAGQIVRGWGWHGKKENFQPPISADFLGWRSVRAASAAWLGEMPKLSAFIGVHPRLKNPYFLRTA
jgi:hypothetical protein